MATRFYLPSSGTAPLTSLSVRSDWEQSTGLVRLPCFTTKQNTALSTSQRTWPSTSTQQWVWYQYQSEQLLSAYSWTTADTVSMVLGKMAETTANGDTHLAYIVRVVSSDGATERGVVGLYHATSTEVALIASAATRIHSARTNGATAFSSQIGDRIIIEIGLHGVTPAAEIVQMRVGDPSATADFALTSALTTDLCSWVELSRTVSLGTPATSITPNDAAHAHTSDSPVLTQTHNVTPSDAVHSHAADSPVFTQTHNIIPNDAVHSQSADATTITQPTIITPNKAAHGHTADIPVILQTHNLTPSDGLHGHASDIPALSQVHTFFPADSVHGHTADAPTFSQVHNISPSDTVHTHTAEAPAFSQVHNIAPNDVFHAHAADATTVTQSVIHFITPRDCYHSFSAESPAVIQLHGIIPNDCIHFNTVDSPTFSQVHAISPAYCYHAMTVDVAVIGQVHMMLPRYCSHAMTADTPTLTTEEILTIFVFLRWLTEIQSNLHYVTHTSTVQNRNKITVKLQIK